MKNSDKPINPLQNEGFPSHQDVIDTDYCIGLTKREYFAAMAMQGIINSVYSTPGNYQTQLVAWKESYGDILVKEAIAKDAINIADALLTSLETK